MKVYVPGDGELLGEKLSVGTVLLDLMRRSIAATTEGAVLEPVEDVIMDGAEVQEAAESPTAREDDGATEGHMPHVRW